MKRNRITLFFLSILTLLALGAGKSNAQDLRPGPNIAGHWTIYAYNVDKPGSSLKTIEVTQNGNITRASIRQAIGEDVDSYEANHTCRD